MATLGTLRNVVARKMGMDNTTSSADQTLLDEWINQGAVEVLLRTHCTIGCMDIDVTANTWKYTLPTAPLAIKRVTKYSSSSESQRVVHVSPDEIIDFRRFNATPNAGDLLYYAIEGENMLTIYPTPTSAYELEIFYVPRPGTATAAADDFSSSSYGTIPTELHKGIEYYALWQAAEYQEDPSSKAGEKYRMIFEDWVNRVARPAVNRKGGSVAPFARTGRRSRFVSSDRSVYPWV